MKTELKIKIVNAFTVSAIITAIFITAITIYADLNPALKDWLKNTFTHHWIGKGVLTAIIFIIFIPLLLFIFPNDNKEQLIKSLKILFWTTVLGTLAIFGFFIYEYFKH